MRAGHGKTQTEPAEIYRKRERADLHGNGFFTNTAYRLLFARARKNKHAFINDFPILSRETATGMNPPVKQALEKPGINHHVKTGPGGLSFAKAQCVLSSFSFIFIVQILGIFPFSFLSSMWKR